MQVPKHSSIFYSSARDKAGANLTMVAVDEAHDGNTAFVTQVIPLSLISLQGAKALWAPSMRVLTQLLCLIQCAQEGPLWGPNNKVSHGISSFSFSHQPTTQPRESVAGRVETMSSVLHVSVPLSKPYNTTQNKMKRRNHHQQQH